MTPPHASASIPAADGVVQTKVGAVVIGRNEAPRLGAALSSVRALGLSAVYADSGSTDASIAIARASGFRVVELDAARPFTAARGRNEGAAALTTLAPALDYVVFLDGDCILDPAFPAAAAATLDGDASIAIVTGHLHEKTTAETAYSRLSALEWQSGAGEITSYGALGGIMMARLSFLREVHGFNESMIAGEDSELGVRAALTGRKVVKIDHVMATHEAGITRFGQWWKRATRAGHALGQRYALHGRSVVRDCAREYRSTLAWGIILPILSIIAAIVAPWTIILPLAAYILLSSRIFRHYRSAGNGVGAAALGAAFGLLSKFANAVGLVKFMLARRDGRYGLIEYK